MSNVSSAEMRIRLKAEIDHMSNRQLQNISQSQSSLYSWVKSAVRRIWDIIITSTIENMVMSIVEWLWCGM